MKQIWYLKKEKNELVIEHNLWKSQDRQEMNSNMGKKPTFEAFGAGAFLFFFSTDESSSFSLSDSPRALFCLAASATSSFFLDFLLPCLEKIFENYLFFGIHERIRTDKFSPLALHEWNNRMHQMKITQNIQEANEIVIKLSAWK